MRREAALWPTGDLPEVGVGHGLQSGVRFSQKARAPSAAVSVLKTAAVRGSWMVNAAASASPRVAATT